jgi:hypothetical protein
MIAQKDLAAELGKTVKEIDTVRQAKLTRAQWKKVGKGMVYTEAGADIIRGHFVVPEIFPTKHKAYVKSQANNPRFVHCLIEGLEGRYPVLIPRKLRGKLVGKYITVDAITDINGTSYRHESLGQ